MSAATGPPPLPRCMWPGCPVRFRTGPARPCSAEHAELPTVTTVTADDPLDRLLRALAAPAPHRDNPQRGDDGPSGSPPAQRARPRHRGRGTHGRRTAGHTAG